jgi:hypothetical protein
MPLCVHIYYFADTHYFAYTIGVDLLAVISIKDMGSKISDTGANDLYVLLENFTQFMCHHHLREEKKLREISTTSALPPPPPPPLLVYQDVATHVIYAGGVGWIL